MPQQQTTTESAEKTPDWIARPARLDDEAGALALSRACFERERTGAEWRWKLMTRPGLAPLTWVAEEEGGALIGHHGAIALRFSMAGEIVDAVQSLDTMTAPHRRGRGLLMGLGKPLYDSWTAAGIGFVLGMPNEKWGSGAAKIGFRPFARLDWLKLVLRPSRALAGRLPGPTARLLGPVDALAARLPALLLRPGALRVREITRTGDEIDAIWRRAAASYADSFIMIRDAAYVQWRFLDCPQPYRVVVAEDKAGPVAYAAFRVTTVEGRRIGWLADLFAPRGASIPWRAALRGAVSAMSAAGADSVAALAGPDSVLYGELRRCGFVPSGQGFAVSLVPRAWAGCESAMSQPQRWQLTGGNFDVI